MKWNNVHRDKLPPDGQHTLLAVNGIYYLTFYDGKRGYFRLKDDPESYFTVEEGPSMYWTEIDEPPHVRDDY
jgi:hypothetical protein